MESPRLTLAMSQDDVKYALGSWLLDQDKLTQTQVKEFVHAARELAQYNDLYLRLFDVCDSGFKAGYISPILRTEIRKLLDEMDKLSDQRELRKTSPKLPTLEIEDEHNC